MALDNIKVWESVGPLEDESGNAVSEDNKMGKILHEYLMNTSAQSKQLTVLYK